MAFQPVGAMMQDERSGLPCPGARWTDGGLALLPVETPAMKWARAGQRWSSSSAQGASAQGALPLVAEEAAIRAFDLMERVVERNLTPAEYDEIAEAALDLSMSILTKLTVSDHSKVTLPMVAEAVEDSEDMRMLVLEDVDKADLHSARSHASETARLWAILVTELPRRLHAWLQVEPWVGMLFVHIHAIDPKAAPLWMFEELERNLCRAMLNHAVDDSQVEKAFEVLTNTLVQDRKDSTQRSGPEWKKLVGAINDDLQALVVGRLGSAPRP
eukprot:CAMPEP_0176088226 /NCGR_PEP_ID=MMETSP0120_2-20121206/44176_1 /TAXON_ID=160619 /ORGANISM="Kryptoperidinium foliaceum, Strain CCMP 1326" /LENGTH=271 /DNA_ID=CAMNT_0017422085 /DNA_START=81 /DNA_END=893 /DNA_ORIENTATION=-